MRKACAELSFNNCFNPFSFVRLVFFFRNKVQVLIFLFVSILYNFTFRMERQRHEDELKNRSTRKSQDADQKTVCYPAVIIEPNFVSLRTIAFIFYSIKMCYYYISNFDKLVKFFFVRIQAHRKVHNKARKNNQIYKF